MTKDVVAIVRSKSDEMPDALRRGIEATGGFSNIKEKRIVIKPNLCCARSSRCGATTDVWMVYEVIKTLNEKTGGNCEISVVESNAEGISADYAFDFLGYKILEKEFRNVKLVNLSKDKKMRIVLEKSKAFDLLEVPETLLKMEYLISIAKLKTHVDQRISCILKNQFGLIPKRRKLFFHPVLSEVLYDLNNLYAPDLCIVDGISGMEGFGPTDGKPKNVDIILVGTNPIATDMVAAKIIGFKPKQIPHLKLIMKANNYSETDFYLRGEKIEKVQTKFKFIPYRYYLVARVGLRLQKLSFYVSNFGGFLQKMRSALALVGMNTINKKISLKHMIKVAKQMIFRTSS